MATLRKEIWIATPLDEVWDAVRDVGALHTRLVPGFAVATKMDGDARIVTFANGLEAREPIVAIDDERRRLVWSAQGGRTTHYNASLEIFGEGDRTRVVWTIDLLPHEMAGPVGAMQDQGLAAMKRTLERRPPSEPPSRRYFEDLSVGQRFYSQAPVTMTANDIKAFAAAFDPQPFHLDEQAATASFFQGLAASGWHTAAVTMRLLVESDLRPAGGTIGAGGEELRWPRAVRPGDVLRAEAEVLELRPSRSRPELGVVKIRLTTFNQANEPVQITTPVLMVPRRPA